MVYCALYAPNALVKRCSFALCVGNTLCIRYQLYGWTVRRLCVTGINLGQRKHKELRTCMLHSCLTLDWRWSDVLLASTFTRGKTLTFLSMQKMFAEVDAHKKWMTFVRRSRQIVNEFRRTPSESQRTDQNSSFLCAGSAWWYVCLNLHFDKSE